MPKSIIYETTGCAREFNSLACNIFVGCEHGCLYCWSPSVTHVDKQMFSHPEIRVTALDVLKSAKALADKGETRPVLLCFSCDPYTPIEAETQLTRKCIMALHEHGLNVIILTKGGLRSTRDFDLLTPKDAYATTLTCWSVESSKKWEPNAALPSERIDALRLAHEKGIETWVSLEPVIYPNDVVRLVELTKDFVGHYKLGTMNYHPHGKTIDWKFFGWDMKRFMDKLGVKYYFKKDLLREMGVSEFKQTWECR